MMIHIVTQMPPMSTPEGIAKDSTRLTKPSRGRSVFGASERMNAGMPMVNQPVIVT